MASLEDYINGVKFPGGLSYAWVCQLRDNTTVRQFVGSTESPFPNVVPGVARLYLVNAAGRIAVSIDYLSGKMTMKDVVVCAPVSVNGEAVKYSPVFRAWDVGSQKCYEVGYFVSGNDGGTIKKTVVVDSSGNIYFGE